ncbi:MAG: hypothetical protein MJ184_00065 [Treponema sp.]|uniref:cell division protein ZapB n=1 Tax=Treponema sp. TaxID=166 RepID=UPI00298D7816|nr:cell division protein ZapB [Treponema sp.]MCQ2599735.1 hypothetical protein [Treponema sp.]
MISIDQVLLLQQKVESAVQKIVELKAENDALRNKCSELTNALSEKSELLASFTADEKKIEDSILGALDRLNKIENSVLSQAGQNAAPKSEAAPLPATNNNSNVAPITNTEKSETPAEASSKEEVKPVENENATIEKDESKSGDNDSADIAAPEFDLDVSTDESSDQDSDEKEEKFDIF